MSFKLLLEELININSYRFKGIVRYFINCCLEVKNNPIIFALKTVID